MEKLGVGKKIEKEFLGKRYTLERPDAFMVLASAERFSKRLSVSGDVEVGIKEEFYDIPYLLKLKEGLKLSPNSALKFFFSLPLFLKLIAVFDKKEVEIDTYKEHTRIAWHGPVYGGDMCTYFEPEVFLEIPKTKDAIIPMRVVNETKSALEISKIFLDPRFMMLWKGDKGYFTNKVYVHLVSNEEFRVEYGKITTTKAGKLQKIVGRKAEPKSIVTKFVPLGAAREFGL